MSNSESIRQRTLRVILEIDLEEVSEERYESIFGMAKDLGMSVPEYAAEALRVVPGSDVALCVRRMLMKPASFDGSGLDVKAGDVRIVNTEWRPAPLPAPASQPAVEIGTSKDKIRQWLAHAKHMNATHLIVVCDTFDYSDFPVFVTADQNVQEVARKYDGRNMTRLMEVYLMELDLESQLQEPTAMHFAR